MPAPFISWLSFNKKNKNRATPETLYPPAKCEKDFLTYLKMFAVITKNLLQEKWYA